MKPLKLNTNQMEQIIADELNYPTDELFMEYYDICNDLKSTIKVKDFKDVSNKNKKQSETNKYNDPKSIKNILYKIEKNTVNNLPKNMVKFVIDSCELEMRENFTLLEIRESDKLPDNGKRLERIFRVISG